MIDSQKTKSGLLSLLLVFFVLAGFVPASADNLGISVSVNSASDESNRSSSKEIWFLGDQGSSVPREIQVRALGDIPQQISLRFYDVETVNGEKAYQQNVLSRANDWFEITNNRVLNPGEVASFEIVSNIPLDAREELFEGLMVVVASPAEEPDIDTEGQGAVGIVSSSAGIAIPFKIAIGDLSALQPIFTIDEVEGVLIGEDTYVRTFFRNEGLTPIILVGSLQLSDRVFQDRIFGPYDFRTREIPAGTTGFIDIPAEEGIVEGDYTAYVVAEQLGVRETRLFDVYIEYLPPGTLKFWDIAPWGIAGLFFAVMMILGIRLLRGAAPAEPKTAMVPREPKQPRAPRPAKPPRIAIRRPEPKIEQPVLRTYESPPTPSWYSTPEPAPKPKRFSLRAPAAAKPEVVDPLEALKSAVSRMEKQFNALNTDFAATKAPEIRDIALKPKRVAKPRATPAPKAKADASKLEPGSTTVVKKSTVKKSANNSSKKS